MIYSNLPLWSRYTLPILGGVLMGIFVLLPAYEFVTYFDPDFLSLRDPDIRVGAYVQKNWWEALTLQQPFKLVFYAVLGGGVGTVISLLSQRAIERNLLIERLKAELSRDLDSIIAEGESEYLEFKSSYRYDLKQGKVNKALEIVIMKTLAGMMNSEGGTLLIGVDDEGKVLGMEQDYNTLKRKDRDGFEQLLNSGVADKLGTPACEWIKVFFHQKGDLEVCRIRVVPAPQPVYLKDGKDSKFYIRTGAGTRAMNLEEAIGFIQRKWG